MSTNSDFTRGGQITFHYWQMLFQVVKKTGKLMVAVMILLTLSLSYMQLDQDEWLGALYYWKYVLHAKLGTSLDHVMTTVWHEQSYQNTLGQLLNTPFLQQASSETITTLQISFVIACGLSFIFLFGSLYFFQKRGQQQTQDQFVSGRQTVAPRQLARAIKKPSPFKIDGNKLFTRDFEVQHMLLAGTTGSGKSVLIRKLLKWIRERGDKAVIYDKGCTFVGKFYDETTDVILNPFDERCAYWDIWCDAVEPADFENMANAFIPLHGDGDPFWVQSARTIFSCTGFKLKDDPKRSTERLLELLLTSDLNNLHTFLQGTESASLTSDKIEKTAISIKSVLAAYIKSLRFLAGLDQTDHQGKIRPKFSIRNWVQDDAQTGFLFLSSHAEQHSSLRPLISAWIDIASTAILGMNENPNRRIWVIMDEAPTLHKLPELPSNMAEVRKFGGCYVIGLQSFAQLIETYGDKAGKVLLDLLNTRLYFRASSQSMAKMVSDELGQQELKIATENTSYGANSIRDGISLGQQTVMRPAVRPDEIMMMENLNCWVRPIGKLPITKLKLRYDNLKQVNSDFIKRSLQDTPRLRAIDMLLADQHMGQLGVLKISERKRLLSSATYYENEEEGQRDLKQIAATLAEAKAFAQELIQKVEKAETLEQTVCDELKNIAEQQNKENEKANQADRKRVQQDEVNINDFDIHF